MDERWHLLRRVGFRFAFALTLLFVLPFPFSIFGIPSPVATWWDLLWEPIVPWVARHVFGITHDFPRWSGGETTWYYVQVACVVALAVVLALVWSLVDRVRPHHRVLDAWLRFYLRFFLAAVLFRYGWSKVLGNQFPSLGPERLSEHFGEASPNGLLWAFMGFSEGYMAFGGLAEVVPGVLLCFRRTTLLGAVLGIAVMSNVVALNFAFDVGVKLDSTFYLLALAYLAAPDIPRLVEALTRSPESVTHAERMPTLRWSRVAGVFAAFVFAHAAYQAWDARHTRGRSAPTPPLYGLYEVEGVVRNGAPAPVSPDSSSWKTVAIGRARSTIRLASGALGFYQASVDTSAHRIRFVSRDGPTARFVLAYDTPDAGSLVLRGRLGGDSVELRLRKRDERAYRLVSHPFHWAHDSNENR